jgi:hypothetical protein
MKTSLVLGIFTVNGLHLHLRKGNYKKIKITRTFKKPKNWKRVKKTQVGIL